MRVGTGSACTLWSQGFTGARASKALIPSSYGKEHLAALLFLWLYVSMALFSQLNHEDRQHTYILCVSDSHPFMVGNGETSVTSQQDK